MSFRLVARLLPSGAFTDPDLAWAAFDGVNNIPAVGEPADVYVGDSSNVTFVSCEGIEVSHYIEFPCPGALQPAGAWTHARLNARIRGSGADGGIISAQFCYGSEGPIAPAMTLLNIDNDSVIVDVSTITPVEDIPTFVQSEDAIALGFTATVTSGPLSAFIYEVSIDLLVAGNPRGRGRGDVRQHGYRERN